MAQTNFIQAIENKSLLQAHELLEKTLYRKAGVFLEEKRKQVSAKMWPSKNLTESDEKTIFKAARRKSLKDKMKQLKIKKDKEKE
jgi:hypothetical protein